MQRSVFFLSGSTAITAEILGESLLSQFNKLDLKRSTLPFINSAERAEEAVQQINQAFNQDSVAPIVFDTTVDPEIHKIIKRCNALVINVYESCLSQLEQELGQSADYVAGKSHGIKDKDSYKLRMDALQYALNSDDGTRTRQYDEAEVILLGVSRCGKTPTCLYLALQFGVKAANYPLTEDDLEDMRLPKVLRPHKSRCFGLTINPQRLSVIRSERRANSRYASLRQCEAEVREVEGLFRRESIPFLSVTNASIEELSTQILETKHIERHFYL